MIRPQFSLRVEGSVPKLPSGFSIEEARRLQRTMAEKVVEEDRLPEKIRLVGGVDSAYHGERAVAAAVVLDYNTLELVEARIVKGEAPFPYIPTLLSFREAPLLLKALEKLRTEPEVVLVDGHGVAHPYGCGLASHLGVVSKRPTIGVAKGVLCGEVGSFKENMAPLIFEGRLVGVALRPKLGARPLYVSVGHKVTLTRAVEVVLQVLERGRIPEPIRVADALARRALTGDG